MYTLIYVTVKIQKLQRSINFRNSGLTPLLSSYHYQTIIDNRCAKEVGWTQVVASQLKYFDKIVENIKELIACTCMESSSHELTLLPKFVTTYYVFFMFKKATFPFKFQIFPWNIKISLE